MLRKLIAVTVALLICHFSTIANQAVAAEALKGCPATSELYIEKEGTTGYWKTESGWHGVETIPYMPEEWRLEEPPPGDFVPWKLIIPVDPAAPVSRDYFSPPPGYSRSSVYRVERLWAVIIKSPHASGHGAPHQATCVYHYYADNSLSYLNLIEPSENQNQPIAVKNLNEWAKGKKPDELFCELFKYSPNDKCEFDLYSR